MNIQVVFNHSKTLRNFWSAWDSYNIAWWLQQLYIENEIHNITVILVGIYIYISPKTNTWVKGLLNSQKMSTNISVVIYETYISFFFFYLNQVANGDKSAKAVNYLRSAHVKKQTPSQPANQTLTFFYFTITQTLIIPNKQRLHALLNKLMHPKTS